MVLKNLKLKVAELDVNLDLDNLSQSSLFYLVRVDYLLTPVNAVVSWARQGSFWPMTFGLACCAVEMMHTTVSRYD